MTQPQFCFCGKCLVLLTHLLRRLSHFQKEICNAFVCVVVVCVILNVIFLCARDRADQGGRKQGIIELKRRPSRALASQPSLLRPPGNEIQGHCHVY